MIFTDLLSVFVSVEGSRKDPWEWHQFNTLELRAQVGLDSLEVETDAIAQRDISEDSSLVLIRLIHLDPRRSQCSVTGSVGAKREIGFTFAYEPKYREFLEYKGAGC